MPLIHRRRSPWLLALAVAAIGAVTAIVFDIEVGGDRTAGPATSQALPTSNVRRHGGSRPAPLQPPPALEWAWPLETAMRRIDGARITAARRVIRIDSSTTLCSGVGTRVVRAGVVRWHSFDCTFTTLRHGIDQDVDFRVSLIGANRYAISAARWVGEQR